MSNRIKYTVDEYERNTYRQMPNFLFEGEFSGKKISNDARVLYMLLRDRHELSYKNKWVDDEGYIYLIYSRESMCQMMGISINYVTKLIKELKKFKLIDEQRIGLGKPNRIFLLAPESSSKKSTNGLNPQTPSSCDSGITTEVNHESRPKGANQTNIDIIDISDSISSNLILSVLERIEQKLEKEKTDRIRYDEIITQNVESEKGQVVEQQNNPILSVLERIEQKLKKEKTDKIRRDEIITQNIESEKEQAAKQQKKESPHNVSATQSTRHGEASQPRYNYNEVEKIIKLNIEYNNILIDDTVSEDMLKEICHAITITICSDFKDNRINMGDQIVYAEAVKSVFFKLGREDVEYFAECFNRQTKPITKTAAYIRASLFKNYGTDKHYITNRVHVDFPQFAEPKIQSKQ